MATLTSSFAQDSGALFLGATATGIAPSIEFTYPIAHITGGSVGIEYCHAVSSTSESVPSDATVSNFYQSVPVTSKLAINDGITVITGKIPSLGFAPVNVVCRLALSLGAQVDPTTQEYITEHGSLLLDDSGANTTIQAAQLTFSAIHSQVVVGFQGEDRGLFFKLDKLSMDNAFAIQVNFGKYVVFPPNSDNISDIYFKYLSCYLTHGNNAAVFEEIPLTGPVSSGAVFDIYLPPWEDGKNLTVHCPDVKAYHAKEMIGKYTVSVKLNGGLPPSVYDGAYSFIADDESTTDDSVTEHATETNDESTETNEPTTSDATETSDESSETNETNETNEANETNEDTTDEATGESTDEASEISTSGAISTGFTLVGIVAITFALSTIG